MRVPQVSSPGPHPKFPPGVLASKFGFLASKIGFQNLFHFFASILKKTRNHGFWFPKTLPKAFQNPSTIDVPENLRFCINFYLNCNACCKSRTSKFVRPRSVLLALHTIELFDFGMLFGIEKLTKTPFKTMSEPLTHRCQKRLVLQHRFF